MPSALPAGPKSALREMWRYFHDPLGFAATLAKQYGDPFTMPATDSPLVVTGSPDGIRAIFAADPATFAPYSTEAMVPVLGAGSILLQHGTAHRRARKLMQPPFHGARMRAYGATMRETALQHLRAAPVGRAFPIEDTFRTISLDVIVRTIFGVAAADGVVDTRKGVLAAVGAFGPLLGLFTFLRRDFGGFGPWARFRRLLGEVHQLLRREIAARRASAPGEDILSMLVAARDEAGAPMDEQEIVEQLFTMVIAGHETTATALAWAADELYRQPALVSRLRDELTPTGGDAERLAASSLLDAVCAETLRLRPLIPMVSRRCLKPFSMAGVEIPAGVGVAACMALAHQREDLYPEPHVFRPERFLDGRTFNPHGYLPFGGGARRCLGAAFALYEMKIVLGTLILEGGIELESPKRARASVRAATVGPKGGVRVIRKGE